MGRPRKSESEKLIPAKVCLSPARFDQLSRIAQRRGDPLAVLLRQMLDPSFREPKTVQPLIEP